MSSWIGLVTRKTRLWLGVYNFPPLPSSPWKGRGARNGISKQSSPCDEASTKIPIVGGSGNFQVGEHIHVPGGRHTPTPRDRSSCTPGPSRLNPMYLFFWLFICTLYHILCNKPVNINSISQSSMSDSSKLSNPWRGTHKPQFIASWSEYQEQLGTCD